MIPCVPRASSSATLDRQHAVWQVGSFDHFKFFFLIEFPFNMHIEHQSI